MGNATLRLFSLVLVEFADRPTAIDAHREYGVVGKGPTDPRFIS